MLTSLTVSASSTIVNSPGLPMFIGPVWSPSIKRIRPSTYKTKVESCMQLDPHVATNHTFLVESRFSFFYFPRFRKINASEIV